MFYHGYDSYLKYAYPYDELKPLSCSGQDTWGRLVNAEKVHVTFESYMYMYIVYLHCICSLQPFLCHVSLFKFATATKN